MSVESEPTAVDSPVPDSPALGRRTFLAGAVGAGAVALYPGQALAGPARPHLAAATSALSGAVPLPPAVRSRQALTGTQVTGTQVTGTLPLTQHGTTFNLAQAVRWLDGQHFAVGRWDGTMSIFEFETAPFVGPMVTAAVNTPSAQGVQMIAPMPHGVVATSNDWGSLSLWAAPSDDWAGLRLRSNVSYDPALGVATSGVWLPAGNPSTLAVGHDSGFLSLWAYDPTRRTLRLIRTVDVRNPQPVNPWGSHVMYGMCPLVPSGAGASIVAGSDDGYVSIVRVPSGTILSQTVFNPAAQRGINSVSAFGNQLLVANCSVGADDDNLWYFAIDPATWNLTLLDSMNLIIDPLEIQSFNFDTIWGRYSGGACWFAGTEEGALWMGTADSGLNLIGNQPLADGAIGAALDYTAGPGRLAAVIHNLNQFSTGAP